MDGILAKLDLSPNQVPLIESMECSDAPARGSDFFARQVLKRFGTLIGGEIEIHDAQQSRVLSSPPADKDPYAEDLLRAKVFVGQPEMYRRIMFGGTIGAAESYMQKQWSTDSLTNLIRIMIRNLDDFTRLEKGWARIKNSIHYLQHAWRHNSIRNSRKNIYEHYDLGNDFYRLFLDPTLNYSSGLFADLSPTSETVEPMLSASVRKMDAICNKLQLSSLDHVLEIGTGWGAMAIHMASKYRCRVTTTTISKQQHDVAVQRVREAGLENLVTVLRQDYRELEGQFDKIVSIEMIEAVGHQYYDAFFEKCNRLLRDDGAMLLQAITIGEQNYEYHIRHVDFIGKYIFPGGSLPSISALSRSVGRVSKMRLLQQTDMTRHYERTMLRWREKFFENIDAIRDLDYDEAFLRRWHFYLCYCEAAFAERRVHCTHLTFAKPNCKLDLDIQHGESSSLTQNAADQADLSALWVLSDQPN
jgi:cyclopropane-fatty-acyl-phospholipid synthase